MLQYNIHNILQESYNNFILTGNNINESFEIKDVRKVSSFEEPTRKFRGKKKINQEKTQYKRLVDIKKDKDDFSVVRNNIKSTISPIYNIIISEHTKDQLAKRSNTHGPNYPLQSIELILPYITKSLLNGSLRPNSKFAFAFEGDHIAFICNLNTTHSEDAKTNNDPGDIEVSPVIDIIVRSAIQPTSGGEIYVDLFTKSLMFSN